MHTHTLRMKYTQKNVHKAPGVYIQCVHRTSLVCEWDCLKERKRERELVCIWVQMSVNVWVTMCLRLSDLGLILGWLGPAGSTCDNLVLSWRHRPSSVSLISQAACKQLWLMTNSYKRFSFSPSNPNGNSVFIYFSFISARDFPVLFRWGELQHISRDQWSQLPPGTL